MTSELPRWQLDAVKRLQAQMNVLTRSKAWEDAQRAQAEWVRAAVPMEKLEAQVALQLEPAIAAFSKLYPPARLAELAKIVETQLFEDRATLQDFGTVATVPVAPDDGRDEVGFLADVELVAAAGGLEDPAPDEVTVAAVTDEQRAWLLKLSSNYARGVIPLEIMIAEFTEGAAGPAQRYQWALEIMAMLYILHVLLFPKPPTNQ